MEELRQELVRFIRRKFLNLYSISDLAEDIVHDAFLLVKNETQYNFGYLSMVCVRLAYREHKRQKRQETDYIDLLVSEDDVVAQVMEREEGIFRYKHWLRLNRTFLAIYRTMTLKHKSLSLQDEQIFLR